MARKRSLTSTLYRLARDSNNVRSIRRGPVSAGQRVIRRNVYKRTNTGVAGILRALGLSGKRRR